MRLLVPALAGLLLAGCASSPVAPSQAKPAKAVYAYSQPAAASVRITRDNGTFGSGCDALVSVDQTPAALLDAGQTVTLHVTADRHLVESRMKGGLCQAGTHTILAAPRTGETLDYRIAIGGQGDMSLEPTIQ